MKTTAKRIATVTAALLAAAILAGCGGGGGGGGGGGAPSASTGNTGNTGVTPGNTGNNGNAGNTGNTGNTAPDSGPEGDATHDSLIEAITLGEAAEVRRILGAGVNPNQRDALGGTPLLLASGLLGTPGVDGENAAAVVRELLAGGADPNLTHPNAADITPLHNILNAAYVQVSVGEDFRNVESILDVVRLLLDAGADPNARDSTGETPLDTVESLVRFQPTPQEERLYRRLRTLFQNAGGGNNGNNSGNNGNGGQTCPAGQTGTPPNCRSGNSQAQRGPGYTDTLGGARAALAALDGQARRLIPIYASASCHTGSESGTCNTRNRVPNIGVAGRGLRHPGGMGWAVPTDVGPYRQFVGRFRDGTGDTYGAWGEWSYAYTASDRVERGRSDNTRTLRHGTATGSGGCARADYGCTAFYALANHGGLLYEGTPDGTATYEGQTWASVLRASADTQDDYVIAGNSLFAGDATLTANFDRSSVNARFHSFNGSEPELRGGITFSGIPLITSDGQFRQGRNGTSDRFIDGAFFGPDGTEAAGTWYVDSTTPTRRSCGAGGGNLCNQGSIVVGSFAAKEQ